MNFCQFFTERLRGRVWVKSKAAVESGADGRENFGGRRKRVFVGVEFDQAFDLWLFAGSVGGQLLDQGADFGLRIADCGLVIGRLGIAFGGLREQGVAAIAATLSGLGKNVLRLPQGSSFLANPGLNDTIPLGLKPLASHTSAERRGSSCAHPRFAPALGRRFGLAVLRSTSD